MADRARFELPANDEQSDDSYCVIYISRSKNNTGGTINTRDALRSERVTPNFGGNATKFRQPSVTPGEHEIARLADVRVKACRTRRMSCNPVVRHERHGATREITCALLATAPYFAASVSHSRRKSGWSRADTPRENTVKTFSSPSVTEGLPRAVSLCAKERASAGPCLPPCYYSPAGVLTRLRISRHQVCCNRSGQTGKYVAATSKLQWLRHWWNPRPLSCASRSRWQTSLVHSSSSQSLAAAAAGLPLSLPPLPYNLISSTFL